MERAIRAELLALHKTIWTHFMLDDSLFEWKRWQKRRQELAGRLMPIEELQATTSAFLTILENTHSQVLEEIRARRPDLDVDIPAMVHYERTVWAFFEHVLFADSRANIAARLAAWARAGCGWNAVTLSRRLLRSAAQGEPLADQLDYWKLVAIHLWRCDFAEAARTLLMVDFQPQAATRRTGQSLLRVSEGAALLARRLNEWRHEWLEQDDAAELVQAWRERLSADAHTDAVLGDSNLTSIANILLDCEKLALNHPSWTGKIVPKTTCAWWETIPLYAVLCQPNMTAHQLPALALELERACTSTTRKHSESLYPGIHDLFAVDILGGLSKIAAADFHWTATHLFQLFASDKETPEIVLKCHELTCEFVKHTFDATQDWRFAAEYLESCGVLGQALTSHLLCTVLPKDEKDALELLDYADANHIYGVRQAVCERLSQRELDSGNDDALPLALEWAMEGASESATCRVVWRAAERCCLGALASSARLSPQMANDATVSPSVRFLAVYANIVQLLVNDDTSQALAIIARRAAHTFTPSTLRRYLLSLAGHILSPEVELSAATQGQLLRALNADDSGENAAPLPAAEKTDLRRKLLHTHILDII